MELGKVINPALQRGQDGSIKAVQKDSSIFNYCFQSREECQKEQACCLQNRRIQGAWIPYCCSPYTPPPPVVAGYVQSIYMEKAARRHTPLENRSVSEGLNESGETGAECSGEKITHLDAESGINRC